MDSETKLIEVIPSPKPNRMRIYWRALGGAVSAGLIVVPPSLILGSDKEDSPLPIPALLAPTGTTQPESIPTTVVLSQSVETVFQATEPTDQPTQSTVEGEENLPPVTDPTREVGLPPVPPTTTTNG